MHTDRSYRGVKLLENAKVMGGVFIFLLQLRYS